MFTGLIECLGMVEKTQNISSQSRFYIHPRLSWKDIQDGESIAVNGVCLSVESHRTERFVVYASQETMSATNLGNLGPGSLVNLERALKFGARVGGHLVSGHVDCLATVERLERRGESIFCRLLYPSEFAPQMLRKGSIALDGISLTINACSGTWLEVNLIPDTGQRTNIGQWRPGLKVNMETDLLGKYVVNYLQNEAEAPDLDKNFLARNGFI